MPNVRFGKDFNQIRLNDEEKANVSHCMDFDRQAELFWQLRRLLVLVRLIVASFVFHESACLSYEASLSHMKWALKRRNFCCRQRAVRVARLISEAVAGTVRMLSWFET